jgi:Predicted N6-adenine-specific DNA methylase
MSFDFFLPCPRGLEASLAAELAEIAASHLNGAPFTAGAQVPGGVHFRGGWAAGMAANLYSRLASRVLLKIAHRPYRSEQDIYALAVEQRWEQWFSANETLRVDVTAIKSPLRSLEFTTLRVKDAICDRLREVSGARPTSTPPCPTCASSPFSPPPTARCISTPRAIRSSSAAGASTRARRRCARIWPRAFCV